MKFKIIFSLVLVLLLNLPPVQGGVTFGELSPEVYVSDLEFEKSIIACGDPNCLLFHIINKGDTGSVSISVTGKDISNVYLLKVVEPGITDMRITFSTGDISDYSDTEVNLKVSSQVNSANAKATFTLVNTDDITDQGKIHIMALDLNDEIVKDARLFVDKRLVGTGEYTGKYYAVEYIVIGENTTTLFSDNKPYKVVVKKDNITHVIVRYSKNPNNDLKGGIVNVEPYSNEKTPGFNVFLTICSIGLVICLLSVSKSKP